MSLKELPSDNPGEINSQRLPDSDSELEKHFHSLAHTMRVSFNDYAFVVVTGSDASHIPGLNRKQPIKIPTLEDIIALFGLEKGISWQTNTGGFEGFDETGRRLVDGNINKEEASSLMTGIDSFDSWTRETYGTSSKTVLRRYTSDRLELAFVLGFDDPIEPGKEYAYESDLHYINSEGKRVVTSYQGSMVRKTKFLSYWNREEGFGIYYHEPFFQRQKESLTKPEVERAYNLRGSLEVVGKESGDSGLLAFLIQEETRPEGEYHELKVKLGLDKLSWSENPSVLTILRLDEMAKFLERRYRETHGLDEVYYRDYEERIAGFRNQLWLLLRQQPSFAPIVEKSNQILFRPSYARTKELYPKGLGPFDPGPHNPGGPGDPRGPHPGGPDPRGPDPRGPR